MSVSGSCDPRFEELGELLADSVASGADRGASVCVVHEGRTVVDLWHGSADPEATVPWQSDTIVPVWSITKVMANLCVMMLVDRGLIDVDAPVATYWPEFAAAGKEAVTVAHVLSHASGVSGWDQPVEVDDLFDWDRSTAMLAAQTPWWEPGSAPGYHLLNQGHLVGEIVRRVTGETIGAWFAREVAAPLGADFHIGLAAEHDHRVSPITAPRPLPTDPAIDPASIDPESPAVRTFTGPFLRAREANSERWRRAEIPAANGHGNARSIARIQSVVSHDGQCDGVRLLSPETVESIIAPRVSGTDVVLGINSTFGLGWALPDPTVMPSVAPGRRCYWGGLGGSVVVNDLDRNLTFAYAMNRLIFEHVPGTMTTRPCGDSRSDALLAALDRALG
ncbi:serine hydrolase domain-containing protein [Aeromicrobium sp. CF3.5]|uniref:serine hydrolase domain-containing protein n=1 Tax=Aeromicrobium sp. CF3.5 TaxID=3373078 RepID=UPI003EE62827